MGEGACLDKPLRECILLWSCAGVMEYVLNTPFMIVKVIRHAKVDSIMIFLDNQAHQ